MLGVLGILALAALACATPVPRNNLAPGHAGAPDAKRFLLCAPNTVLSLPGTVLSPPGTEVSPPVGDDPAAPADGSGLVTVPTAVS